MRGIAALLVLLGHSRKVLFEAQGLPVAGTGWEKLLLAPTAVAQEAVAVFFVLSGYLVGGHVLRHLRADRFSWPEYLAKRISRLSTVLLPGIAVTALVDALSRHWFLASFERLTGRGPGPPGAATTVCNAVFLQRARCATYGSDDSLWSLSYEFWFYLAFAGAAVCAVALGRKRLAGASVGALVLLGSVGAFGIGLLWFFPTWLIGVVVAEVEDRVASRPGRVLGRSVVPALVFLLVLALAVSDILQPSDRARFVLVGVATAPLILALAIGDPTPRSRTGLAVWSAAARLGPWSYSLYIFHLPLVVLAACALRHADPGSRVLSTGSVYALAAAVLLAVYPLALATERHTPRVRAVLLRLVGRSQASTRRDWTAAIDMLESESQTDRAPGLPGTTPAP